MGNAPDRERLSIAMIGTRGVPATWGGVERHVEELGVRLTDMGHSVTVFSREWYAPEMDDYRGMRVVTVPTWERRGLEAAVHSFRSTFRAMRQHFDVVHYHAVGPGLATPLPRYLSRSAVVQTIHGLDGDRAKWSAPSQAILRFGTYLSARVPDTTVVVSRDLQRHYQEEFSRETVYIPNGVTLPVVPADAHALERWGLAPGCYLLYVGRLVPEKAPHLLVEAFAGIPTDLKLVLVGASSHTDDYADELARQAAKDPRVVMAGAVFGDDLATIYAHAAAFVLPSVLEGLPLTLLEAASHRLPLVVSSIPPHQEVAGTEGPGARFAEPGSVPQLRAALELCLQDLPSERAGAQARSAEILSVYDWDRAARELEQVYLRIAATGPSGPR
ncbi:MAG: hypothetical protein QOK15_215 [Nocardioidaceae bacterium]|nr:hypothetical protein [Nocardioidaceae bacterium]